MRLSFMLADVRPTDLWDSGDVLGVAVLIAIVVVVTVTVRVIRRR